MRDREYLVFVEVRYRKHGKSSNFASAAASVDRRKQRKLALTAALFLSRGRRYVNFPVRFDVVAIDVAGDGTASLDWIKDAFRPEY